MRMLGCPLPDGRGSVSDVEDRSLRSRLGRDACEELRKQLWPPMNADERRWKMQENAARERCDLPLRQVGDRQPFSPRRLSIIRTVKGEKGSQSPTLVCNRRKAALVVMGCLLAMSCGKKEEKAEGEAPTPVLVEADRKSTRL